MMMKIIILIIWITHKSAKSCVALNLLKPTGFSEGLGTKKSHQKHLRQWGVLANMVKPKCMCVHYCKWVWCKQFNSHLKKGLDMFGVCRWKLFFKYVAFSNHSDTLKKINHFDTLFKIKVLSVWQTQLQFYHQIRSLNHNRVRGDRLHVCLHDIAYW